MGICDSQNKEETGPTRNPNDRTDEILLGKKTIPVNMRIKLSKSICKITYGNEDAKIKGTGFFIKYNNLKCLMSVYHVINLELINKNIEIEIYNEKKYNIALNSNRYIKLFNKPIDISIVEIKDTDNINNEIEYLYQDLNYKEIGYKQYLNEDIISLGYPLGEDLSTGNGRILNIDDYEFEHDITTEVGSPGSPIILYNNMLKVIGIHKYGDKEKNINIGTFIGVIYNEINNNLNIESNNITVDIY